MANKNEISFAQALNNFIRKRAYKTACDSIQQFLKDRGQKTKKRIFKKKRV